MGEAKRRAAHIAAGGTDWGATMQQIRAYKRRTVVNGSTSPSADARRAQLAERKARTGTRRKPV